MQNHYETVFIITPVLSDYQMKETVEKFKKVLLDNKANIVHEENWGLKKLAYPIKNKKSGYYQLFEYQVDPSVIAKLETEFRRDEKIMRFLSFRQDKFSIKYNKMRSDKKKDQKDDPNVKEVKQVQTPKNKTTK